MIPAWNAALPAPAKLNLFLHVLGRREDGLHLLQTVFRLLDVGDEIRLEPRDDGEIVLATPLPGVAPAQDLTLRAARLLQAVVLEEGRRPCGVTITVKKRLPLGGGLGGGSSDAATVLVALNHLWQLHWPRIRLEALGLSLGADVPVFVGGRSAFAEGVGEHLQPLELLPAWYVVVVPPVMVPTAAIFAAPELTRNTPPVKIPDFAAHAVDVATMHGFGRNDLEPVAMARYPAVGEALVWLRQFGQARMSGSGASVFAAFGTRDEAERVLRQVPQGWNAFLARGQDVHPLALREDSVSLGSRQVG